jgi:hypothetical protein
VVLHGRLIKTMDDAWASREGQNVGSGRLQFGVRIKAKKGRN